MNYKYKKITTLLSAATLMLASFNAFSEVTAEQAARLKTDLTPFGAEKSGNDDGSIPAWTGGFTKTIEGQVSGGERLDPFKDEKPLYTITANNVDQYADKLSDGVKALIKKYPDTYHLNVYPTHRTAMAPDWVYDFTAKNAVDARIENDIVVGAYGGIPFPIPNNGLEAINNHLLNWKGVSWESQVNQYQITKSGDVLLVTSGLMKQQMPYYFKEGSAEGFDGNYWDISVVNDGPPIRAGEMIVGQTNLDPDKSVAYVYLAGQRRVRKLPHSCCDTPTPATAGLMTFDELNVYSNRTDGFDWKLLGKKEMLVPYNVNRFLRYKDEDLVTGQHINPEAVRWELHRVWVVEATLAEGKRHQSPRSLYYLDEDTWQAVLGDRWDANKQLWKTLWQFNYVMPDFKGTIQQSFGYYDLLSGEGYLMDANNNKPGQYRTTDRFPNNIFTGQGMAAQGVR